MIVYLAGDVSVRPDFDKVIGWPSQEVAMCPIRFAQRGGQIATVFAIFCLIEVDDVFTSAGLASDLDVIPDKVDDFLFDCHLVVPYVVYF